MNSSGSTESTPQAKGEGNVTLNLGAPVTGVSGDIAPEGHIKRVE